MYKFLFVFICIFHIGHIKASVPWISVTEVCKNTGNYIFEEKAGISLEEFNKTPYEKMGEVLNVKGKETLYSSYVYYNSTSLRLVDYLLYINIHSMEPTNNSNKSLRSRTDIIKLLNFYIEWFNKIDYKNQKVDLSKLSSFLSFNDIEKQSPEFYAIYDSICSKLGKICNKSTTSLRVVTQKNENIPLPNEMLRFYFHPHYPKLLKEAVVALLIKARETLEGKVVKGNIYDDLVLSATKKGATEKEAKDFAWHFLGMYATRGATHLSNGFESHPLHLYSLHVLSNIISFLNTYKFAQSKESYILPKEFKSNCFVGKPYHFWLAGYLSKYQISQNINKRTSFGVSSVLGLAYDLTATFNGRKPDDIFKKPLYSHSLNSKRIDNSLRILGAYFGANQSKISNINDIDPYIELSFKKAKPVTITEPVKLDMKERIKIWIKVVAPTPIIFRLWRLKL